MFYRFNITIDLWSWIYGSNCAFTPSNRRWLSCVYCFHNEFNQNILPFFIKPNVQTNDAEIFQMPSQRDKWFRFCNFCSPKFFQTKNLVNNETKYFSANKKISTDLSINRMILVAKMRLFKSGRSIIVSFVILSKTI